MKAVRESMAFPDFSPAGRGGGEPGQEVRVDASFFIKPDGNDAPPPPQPPPAPPKAPPPATAQKPSKSAAFESRKADLSSYQFPVVDEDTPTDAEGATSSSSLSGQQRASAFKKEGAVKKKSPAFQDK